MTDLITLEQYKIHKGIKNPEKDDVIQNLITSISQLVKTYCATAFVDYYVTPIVETITIEFPTTAISLTEGPVVGIVSVEERANYSSAYTTLTEGAFNFYLDRSSDMLHRTNSSGWQNWPVGPGAVRVEYTAGYAEIPADLKLAVFDLVSYYLYEEYKERRQLAGASITNQNSSTQWRNVDFPDHIKRVLDLYKQINL